MRQLLVILTCLASMVPGLATADDILTGDARTACEVILCLSTGQRPDECTPPLKKFFSIKKPWKRVNFLQLCPKKNASDWDEQKLVYDNLTDPAAVTTLPQTMWRDPGTGIVYQYVYDVRVYTCSQLAAMPQYAGKLPPPEPSVPNGYIHTISGIQLGQAYTIEYYALDGYSNTMQSFQGQDIGIGRALQYRWRTVVADTGATVKAYDWSALDFWISDDPKKSACYLDPDLSWMLPSGGGL